MRFLQVEEHCILHLYGASAVTGSHVPEGDRSLHSDIESSEARMHSFRSGTRSRLFNIHFTMDDS